MVLICYRYPTAWCLRRFSLLWYDRFARSATIVVGHCHFVCIWLRLFDQQKQGLSRLEILVIYYPNWWLKIPQIKWRPVLCGTLLQFLLGIFCIRLEVGREIFGCIGNKTVTFLNYTTEGSMFLYGDFLVNEKHVFAFSVSSISALTWSNLVWHLFYLDRYCRLYSSSVSLLRYFTTGMWCNGLCKIWAGFCKGSLARLPAKALPLLEIFFWAWLNRRYWFDLTLR